MRPSSRNLLCLLVVLLNFELGYWSIAAATASRPNIIFILADDLGWGDLHCYGHPYSRTPNLDRLASEGTRFQQFYATGVTCCPSRTGFMTSKFPATYPVYPANGGFAKQATVTELLKKSGYQTGHFGKWHIGPTEKNGTYGIDEIGGDTGENKRNERKNPRGRDAYIYDQAIQFLEKHKDGPFYMNVWSHISHYPVDPPKSYVDRFKDMTFSESDFTGSMRQKFDRARKGGQDPADCMRRYLADVNSLDEDIGRLLKKVDELGLRENTIVVFSSDQGAPGIDPNAEEGDTQPKKKARAGKIYELTEQRLNMMGYGGGLRGGKHNMYDGGVRIPFIIRWPGHTPAGRVDEKSVVSGIDWLPTVCAAAGVSVSTKELDGEDASASWLGKDFTRTKPLLWKTSNPNSEIAIREGQWKFFYPNSRRGEVELYDMSRDTGEKQNLAAKNPALVKALSAKAEAWNATLPREYVKTKDKEN